MPLHCHKGKTVAATLKSSIAYITNPNKTEDGALISAYECDEHTADLQFLLAQQQYAATTGKQHGKGSVISPIMCGKVLSPVKSARPKPIK
jgi:hypothetical protein